MKSYFDRIEDQLRIAAHARIADTHEQRPHRRWLGVLPVMGHQTLGGLIPIALALATVIAVVIVALSSGGRPSATSAIPARLPFSSHVPPAAATGVVSPTARLVQTFPDPESGPAWGVRTYQARNGMTCLQAGRTESGAIGAIGIDGAYGGDMHFHPFALTPRAGLADCVRDDARGHAFINVTAVNTAASAGQQRCIQHDDALPREHCPANALRDVYFGLLGPDATSITYVGPGGRKMVERTRGPDGAYLVVRPVAHGSCNHALMRRFGAPSSCNYDSQGEGVGAGLRSGEITAVSYRDGHVCHLPAPQGVIVRSAQCPPVGYVSPPLPHVTAAQVKAPVSVQLLRVIPYCQASRPGHPTLLRPCRAPAPAGYKVRPTSPPDKQQLAEISWSARAPVNNPNSVYRYQIDYPCNHGGEAGSTRTDIRVAQRITELPLLELFTLCKGPYTVTVSYVPNIGPSTQGGRPSRAASLLVGRTSFTIK